MKLYLARHGECSLRESIHEPTLSEHGKEDIQLIANFLKPIHIVVENIFHSEKIRARQTAEILTQSVTSKHPPSVRTDLAPTDDVTILANEIATWHNNTLLVGHLPFMAKLVSKLVTGNENKEVALFYPGTLVCLDGGGDSWIIDFVIHPELLKP